MANPRFVSVNLTPEARDALRLITAQLTVDLGRRISMGDAVTAALAVAKRHPEELAAELAKKPKGATE